MTSCLDMGFLQLSDLTTALPPSSTLTSTSPLSDISPPLTAEVAHYATLATRSITDTDQAKYAALAAWRQRQLTLASSASRVHLNTTMDRALAGCSTRERERILETADTMLRTGKYTVDNLPRGFRRILRAADEEARVEYDKRQRAVEVKYQKRLVRLDEEIAARQAR